MRNPRRQFVPDGRNPGNRTVLESPVMRPVRLLALLFYVAWYTGIPILHAQDEKLSSAATLEGSHSDDCPRLHDPVHDASCAAGAMALWHSAGNPPPVVEVETFSPVTPLQQWCPPRRLLDLRLARSPPVR